MKRLVLLMCIALISINTMGQYTPVDSVNQKPIDIRGSRVFVENMQLEKSAAAARFSSLGGVDRSMDYLKYRTGYKTGLGLTIGGASLAAVGYGVSLVGLVGAIGNAFNEDTHRWGDPIFYLGATSFVAGSLCLLSGIPTLCVYKTRLNRLEREYNTSLSVGASPSGFALTINF